MPMTLAELRSTVRILRARAADASRVTISLPMARAIIKELEDLIALSDATDIRDW